MDEIKYGPESNYIVLHNIEEGDGRAMMDIRDGHTYGEVSRRIETIIKNDIIQSPNYWWPSLREESTKYLFKQLQGELKHS